MGTSSEQLQAAIRSAALGAVVGALGSIASGNVGVAIFRGALVGFGVGGLTGFALEPIIEKQVNARLDAALAQTGLFHPMGV